ncbi:MAG: MBL fold metallo-hydrolase [Methanomassiliicoccales archaeon]|jgi:L-ascorbate metabolism protein UlaG (beta-lactamase superfamily)
MIFTELTWIKGSTSWFWIQAGGKNIQIDPSYYPKGQAHGPEMKEKADLILITHSHGDHFQKATVEDLKSDTTVIIAPPNVAKKLMPSTKVIVAEPGKERDIGWAKINVAYAHNLGLKGHILHKKSKCVGYLLTVEGKTIYHAGDTDFIPEMKQLGQVDLALLPIGGTFTMDVDAAAEAAKAIGVKRVIPMHNLKTPVSELKTRLERNPEIQVILAEPGKPFQPF